MGVTSIEMAVNPRWRWRMEMEMVLGRGADVMAEKQRRSLYGCRGVGTRESKRCPPPK
jgi:hypothetical protein